MKDNEVVGLDNGTIDFILLGSLIIYILSASGSI